MRWSTAFVIALSGLLSARGVQLPLGESHEIETLSAVYPGSDFVDFTSHHYPEHRIQIRSHHGWCEEKARSYTGYLITPTGSSLFFYFFESRSKPKEDPVVMWINGGPGGSSAMGLFLEQGPCRIKDDPKGVNDTYSNPYAWNNNANVFFLDQPVDVGFSHPEYGKTVATTEDAAVDVAVFVDMFFDVFKEFKGRAFHMTGESYGGRYLPIFASKVYTQNAAIVEQGREPINLKSVMIGNGGTSLFKLIESSFELMCTKHIDLGRVVLDIDNCIRIAEALPNCKANLRKYCVDSHDYDSCSMWNDHCVSNWGTTAELAGVNWYNVNQTCNATERAQTNCLPGTVAVEKYLNLPSVRQMLGIHPGSDWHLSSPVVLSRFRSTLDFTHQTYRYVAALLERGVRVLNYVGTLDAACDHIGQGLWMDEMPWSGRAGYLDAPTEDWLVDGRISGSIKQHGDLTFMKIYGAGHLVPTDRPKESLEMLDQWISSF